MYFLEYDPEISKFIREHIDRPLGSPADLLSDDGDYDYFGLQEYDTYQPGFVEPYPS